MGAYKGLPEAATATLSENLLADSAPLFTDFDPYQQGGLRTLPDGRVIELRHPTWSQDNPALAERYLTLPLTASSPDDIEWHGPQFRAEAPTMGTEMEIPILYQNDWYNLSPDGLHVVYPDGHRDTLQALGLDPEALQSMVEYKSEIAYGYAEHYRSVIQASVTVEEWMERHNFQTPALTVLPEDFLRRDTNTFDYIRRMGRGMRMMREFGTMSAQGHTQMLDPESAQHALNMYQGVQAVLGLATSAGPIRDGSFNTTLGEHYLSGYKRFAIDPDGYVPPYLENHDYVKKLAHEHPDFTPYDWRELARVLGSPSAGTYLQPAPVHFEEMLRRADEQLREGSIVTSGRVLGWHTDRWRIDIGSLEICNLGTAGGNLHKMLAAQEVTAKYLVARQLEYQQLTDSQKITYRNQYFTSSEAGHSNNIRAGLFGKQHADGTPVLFSGPDNQPQNAQKLLGHIVAIANTGPVPVGYQAERELLATLAPESPQHTNLDETFADYFSPASRMTATDALRRAHQLKPDMPVNLLLTRFSEYRRRHVYEARRQLDQRQGMLGQLACQPNIGVAK